LRVGAVDIGTNSMRLLIVDRTDTGIVELGRWETVTGLGKGVDSSGALNQASIDRTLPALAEFGATMTRFEVERRVAVATSATRLAANREALLELAEGALGVKPRVIGGEEEAELAFSGATAGLGVSLPGPHMVVDIGGGSTEFVTQNGARSIEIGSVRLSERVMPDRPCPPDQLAAGESEVAELFADVEAALPMTTVMGVAGSWTSLAAIHLGVAEYDRHRVHHSRLTGAGLEALVTRLAALSTEETAEIPALDPARAPVILAGAVIAKAAISRLAVASAVVSVSDLLDGLAARTSA
jgi:exopolyphosphatase/guanosine-5'-triphosphate,3'-diphosphate pyrophosphatase